MKEIPLEFADLSKIRDSICVVFFGAGTIASRTSKKFFKPDWTVDNSPAMWGSVYSDLDDIRPPESVLEIRSSGYFVICSTSEEDIKAQLLDLGVAADRIFVSPYVKSIAPAIRLAQLEARLFVGSSGPMAKNPDEGCGLYELKIRGEQITQKKVLASQCHALVKWGKDLVIASTDSGLFAVNKLTLETNLFAGLPEGVRPHGLVWNPLRKSVTVVANSHDALLEFSNNGELNDFHFLLRGNRENSESLHHMNDIAYANGALYVSMFSFTGSWKSGAYDGGIFAFDAQTLEPLGPVVGEAGMPHSVSFDDGELWFCNSLPGMLVKGQYDFETAFPTFCRGLSFAGDLVFVGASTNRNSIDAPLESGSQIRDVASGVYVTTKLNRMARFIPMEGTVPEIHSVFCLTNNGQ